ncbi:YheC/YheD family protein [Thermoactinomyces sp. DSM 45892]|uniref:YheC/YheD family endospore coat-associated protein n=1 Tax=Thermoactinomyces sp. DSM 45892 TaxID=1882753 RepID=UPI00089D4B34|nr:YheC/YheD family protein [Thermoactinomyces sp. DSM 45892]SDZ13457.1 YheC/D like ATP-grasp [Thermoactinomyces sp. DSM 45892]
MRDAILRKSIANHHVLGILICGGKNERKRPFGECGYFRLLAEAGKPLGINIFVFNPKKMNWQRRVATGYIPAAERDSWELVTKPIPNLIYDRCFYNSSNHYLSYRPFLSLLNQDPSIKILGRPLSGKIQTYSILRAHKEITPYLPETVPYQSTAQVFDFIDRYTHIVIKPNGGSHGVGVVAIFQLLKRKGFYIKGRDRKNHAFQTILETKTQLRNWIQQHIGTTRFVIQPYLSLSTPDGQPFDLRILIQKNKEQEWETTGMAIRAGKPNSITSNLHGGGNAHRLLPFIKQHFTPEQVEKINEDIKKLASMVPGFIEENHGTLLELGLDVGIDRNGRVWILEINSKPGRMIFLRTGEHETRKRSIQLPMQYAQSLLMN